MKRTSRGFGIYAEVKDERGVVARVQKSSAAGRRRCWIFIDDPKFVGDRPAPHLSPSEARRVAKALIRFAEGEE